MDLEALSDDELIDHLTTWAGRVAAGEAALLRLIGELDARQAWAAHGVVSCAHWLSWRLGLSPTTARERVRVARALRVLPHVADAFGAGRLSYAQVRAISRVATVADEGIWVELAQHCTGAQLDKAARGAARARAVEQDPAARPEKSSAHARWDDDGDLVLTLRFPVHEASAVLAALEQHQAAEQADRDARLKDVAAELGDASAEACAPEPYAYEEPPYPRMRALVGLFERRTPEEERLLAEWAAERDRRRALRDAARAQQERLETAAAARHLPTRRTSLADGLFRALVRPSDAPALKLQLLVDPVSGWARTTSDELLPPATLQAVRRTLPGRHGLPRRPVDPIDLRRHDLGRASRLVSPALRALLGQLDGERCRWASCTHTRHLHAHHVTFWRDGGATDLSNLVLLCTQHHSLVHEHGYQLALAQDRTLQVRTADGVPVPHRPALPHAPAEDLPRAEPGTLPSRWGGEMMDLGYVVNVLLQHAA